MRKRLADATSGNAILELGLFLPLGILFLTASIDGAFSYLERAALSESVRTAINAQALPKFFAGDEYISDPLAPEISEELIGKLLAEVADSLELSLLGARNNLSLRRTSADDASFYHIEIRALSLEIDPRTGRVVGVPRYLPSFVRRGQLNFKGLDLAPLSFREFISQKLEATADESSTFAIPSALVYNAQNPNSGPEMSYSPTSLLLYAEVVALPRGLNTAVTKTLLGRNYVLREQQLVLMRRSS